MRSCSAVVKFINFIEFFLQTYKNYVLFRPLSLYVHQKRVTTPIQVTALSSINVKMDIHSGTEWGTENKKDLVIVIIYIFNNGLY